MKRLIDAVTELIEFFEATGLQGERSWAGPLREIRDGLASSSPKPAVERLGALFGGMGSLNDYLFHPQNENVPPGQDPHSLNADLDRLLDRCYMEYRL